jgi:hypothetical protein
MQEAAFQALVEWPRTWLADAVESRSLRVLSEVRRTSNGAAAPLLGALGSCTSVVAEPGAGSAAGAMRDAIAPAMRAILGTAPRKWLERVEHEGLDGWLDDAGTPTATALRAAGAASGFGASEVGTLPPADPAMLGELVRAMDAEPDFEREPLWRGAPAETGAIARLAGSAALDAFVGDARNCALVRCAARLVELAALAVDESRAVSGGLPLAPGAGMGWVETARGLLVHRVALGTDGSVLAYRIVAPTEWNFHPEGALPRGLTGAAFGDCAAAERGARWLVQSLDPCVAAHVEVGHA